MTPRQVSPGGTGEPIPTRIANTPRRHEQTVPEQPRRREGNGQSFDAMRPDVPIGPAGPTRRPGAPFDNGLLRDVDATVERRCPQCRDALASAARFCRCGAVLVRRAEPVVNDLPILRTPWQRRLRDRFGGSAFWAAAREVNAGARAKFDAAQSLKFRGTQLIGGLAVFGIGASQLGPWGAELRTEAWDRASEVLPVSYSSVQASSAVVDPQSDALSGFEPKAAIDLDTGRAWATGWLKNDPQGQPCLRQPGAARLVVAFDQPVRVDRIQIGAGLPEGAFDRQQQDRPKLIDIMLSDGTCAQASLADEPGLQSVKVKGRKISSLTLSIVAVYPGEATDEQVVAVNEIVVEHR